MAEYAYSAAAIVPHIMTETDQYFKQPINTRRVCRERSKYRTVSVSVGRLRVCFSFMSCCHAGAPSLMLKPEFVRPNSGHQLRLSQID